MENFRTFFEQNYQGTEAFISEIIEPVFGTAFNKADENLLKSFPTLKPAAERANIISINRFGTCDLDVPMEFFDITLNDHVHLSQSRVYIQQLVRQIMQTYSAALIIFHYTDNELEWRVSYVSKGSSAADATSAKRYTYLMGRNQKCRTAAERFAILAGKEKNETTITDAFSVETLTKQFYNELFAWYQWALSDDKGFAVTYPNDTNTDTDDRRIDEHIIRLITRLMFVWFIKQKKLVPEKIFKTDELKNILTAFDPTSTNSGNYYNAILQNLFFATLNKPIHEREFATETNYQGKDEHYGIKTLFRDAKEGSWFKKSKNEIIDLFKEVPFLNGGLFECLDKENADGKIYYYDGFSRKAGRQKRAFLPNCLFFDPEKGIIPLLEKYNFTVEENTPSDVEVALDPELLGKVFENLLGAFNPETKETARKQSGSFYTPREIVNYMVDESLIAYLTTACPELEEASIRLLFNQDELAEELAQSSEKRNKLATAIRSAKMLDPACGSGAFPMGMLNRMLDILQKLSTVAVHVETPCLASLQYETKLHLIENCIYGIDIQTIAVQITKLRFFISLVCEQTPNENADDNYGILALPNLETKFVAANTLIGLTKKPQQGNLFENPEVEITKNALKDIRHLHFSATNVLRKKEYRKQDARLREKLARLLEENADYTPEDAKQLADWNPYDQNASSPFFDPEWMFGIKRGFDVVIGNPPWGAKLSNSEKELYKNFYKNIDSSTPNTFSYFIGWAFNHYKCFISFVLPDSILIKDYSKTRSLIYNHISEVLWFENSGVPEIHRPFVYVDHDVCVINITKNKHENLQYSLYRYDKTLKKVVENKFNQSKSKMILKEFDFAINLIAKDKDFDILQKVMRFEKLENFMQCHEGIHTGNSRELLFVNINKNKYCKPLYYGGGAGDTIQNYVSYRSQWFVDYRSELIDKTKGYYASLRDERIFNLPKIYISRTGNPFKSFYDKSTYASNNFFSLQHIDYSKNDSEFLKFVLPFILSKLSQYFIRTFAAPRLGSTFIETKIFHLLKFCMPIDSILRVLITEKVNEIILIKESDRNSDTSKHESYLELLIYKLYDLTFEEVKVVDPEFGLTENEYENITL